ncbi:MAG: hypothetical protein ACQCN6_01540 [Candidatus Bathyarchaeia archaeon]
MFSKACQYCTDAVAEECPRCGCSRHVQAVQAKIEAQDRELSKLRAELELGRRRFCEQQNIR